MSETMTLEPETARELLDAAYAGLDLAAGDLVEATERTNEATESASVEKGEWLALGQHVGAEKLFFTVSRCINAPEGRAYELTAESASLSPPGGQRT